MDSSTHGRSTGPSGSYSSRMGRLQRKAKDKVSGKIERFQSRVKRLSNGMLSMHGSSTYSSSYIQPQGEHQDFGEHHARAFQRPNVRYGCAALCSVVSSASSSGDCGLNTHPPVMFIMSMHGISSCYFVRMASPLCIRCGSFL